MNPNQVIKLQSAMGRHIKTYFTIFAGSGTNVAKSLRIDSGGANTIESNITVKSSISIEQQHCDDQWWSD